MARRAKQKFLGKKKVTGMVRASSVAKSPLWAGATKLAQKGLSSAFV